MIVETPTNPRAEIPQLHLPGHDWAARLLAAERDRAMTLLKQGVRRWPTFVVRAADALSRRWLARGGNPYLAEIDGLADAIGRPGGYFLNINHEWGCTTRAAPAADGEAAQLLRVLDWPNDGLGRQVVAAHLEGPAGPWTNLTWPGFAGVIQAQAPGRFAAAFNQAPLRRVTGLLPLDWIAARRRWWGNDGLPPAHLLRRAFETCGSYSEAKELLSSAALALPAIFVLAGLAPEETCVIERLEIDVQVREGQDCGGACAANHFKAFPGRWRPRGAESAERAAALANWRERSCDETEGTLAFLVPPVLNPTTRLALLAEPHSGKLLVQGFERNGPATEVLRSG
ncbi:hypothetical protein [Algihabitans albus]|uniref:hypothetical protein n=1 Tax=Algihabitans albus TaxID=2164067 RepID=UPI000E5D2D6A|nr:hypothetical protein [Algihabitans albus]